MFGRRSYTTKSMAASLLPAGAATAIGSLPHRDAESAAALVLRCLPELPAAPELPQRSPYEAMVVRWAAAIPEVHIAPDGVIHVDRTDLDGAVLPEFDPEMHAGLLTFLDAASELATPLPRVKLQLTGPLTLG